MVFISPKLPKTYLSSPRSFPSWYSGPENMGFSSHFETTLRFEPCGFNSALSLREGLRYLDLNVTLVQEVENFPSNMLVNGEITIEIEETLIPHIPYLQDKLWTDGTYHYRTARLNGDYYSSPNTVTTVPSLSRAFFYENKDFVIQILGPKGKELSDYIKEVIFATGNQCIWTYNLSSQDRFVKKIPQNIGNSWNITIPANIQDWYMACGTAGENEEIQINYLLVDRPPIEKAPEIQPDDHDNNSSSSLKCMDFSLIVVLILSIIILIFHK